MSEALCRDCDFVHSETRKLNPFKWRCLRHPIQLQTAIGLEYVDPDFRPDPPYRVCANIRDAATCELFAPRRTANKEAAE